MHLQWDITEWIIYYTHLKTQIPLKVHIAVFPLRGYIDIAL